MPPKIKTAPMVAQPQNIVQPDVTNDNPKYAGFLDLFNTKPSYGAGFEAPSIGGMFQSGVDMAKNAINSNFAKGAKLGYKVAGEQKQPMQMEVNESEIMDPQTMALMRMGRMR